MRTLRYPRSVIALLLLSAPLQAQRHHPTPDPTPTILHTAAGLTEVGTLGLVPYRIDIPADWNHGLILYFHGYAETPYTYRASGPLNDQVQPLFDRGYAIAESGYSTTGWALAEAYPESESLRQYFLRQYAPGKSSKKNPPIETFVAGGSMGGALVAATLELNPTPYAGGLNLCGSVGPTDLAFQRRFAFRAAFDVYFPNLLPPIDPVPPGYEESRALYHKLEAAFQANPTAATHLRNLMWFHTDRELAEAMVYYTYVIADIQHRAGGNPFDNRDFLYSGTDPNSTASDNLLNDQVRRYTADPHAREYLIRHYTPSGRLARPMLMLQTSYDPRIPTRTLEVYKEQVALAGFSDNLVQQYVHRDGHCAFTPEEIGRTFDELLLWVHTTHRPPSGLLPTAPKVQ
jgi:alpha-beta hydrolase superfamily lysophospholipase